MTLHLTGDPANITRFLNRKSPFVWQDQRFSDREIAFTVDEDDLQEAESLAADLGLAFEVE